MKHQHNFRIVYAPKDSKEITVASGILNSKNFFEASSSIKKIITMAENMKYQMPLFDENNEPILNENGTQQFETIVPFLGEIDIDDSNNPEENISDINILSFNLYHI